MSEVPRPPRQGKGSRARRAPRPARGGVARPALSQAAERRARIDRCRRRSRGDAAQPGGSCARAPRLSGTRGSARAYWKRAPERREAQCTEPGTPRPSAGPGTRAPAAVAPEGPPWARARPGGTRHVVAAGLAGPPGGAGGGGSWRAAEAGDPPEKPRGGMSAAAKRSLLPSRYSRGHPEQGGAAPGGDRSPTPCQWCRWAWAREGPVS